MNIENITTVENYFLALTSLIKNGHSIIQNGHHVTGIELHFSITDAKYTIKVSFNKDFMYVSVNNIITFNSYLIAVKDKSFDVSIKTA